MTSKPNKNVVINTTKVVKPSIANLKALKEIYSDKINKYYSYQKTPLYNEKRDLKREVHIKLNKDAHDYFASKGLKLDGNSSVDYTFRLNSSELESLYVRSPRILEIRELERNLCKQEKQKRADLESWYETALKCRDVSDIPEFDVPSVESGFDCVVD